MALLQIVPATASAAMAPATETFPADPGGLGIRLLDIPVDTQNDSRARTYIIDRFAPGEEINSRIKIENNTATEQTVHLYSGAARIDGGVFVGENADVRNDLSTWTTLATPEVQLPAGESAEVMVTIAVPTDAPEGEQYGAIWAEMRSPASAGGVVQANRVGIRVYLSVGPGNGPPADFTITSLTPARKSGDPQLSAVVTNTGGRALDITGNLGRSAGPGGPSAGPFAVGSATAVASGKTQNVTFTLPRELPNGPWTAGIKLKSGLLEREATASITFPEAGPGEAITPVQNDTTQWLPWAAAAGAALLTLIIAGLLLQRKNRLHTPAADTTENGTRRANRQQADVTR